MKKLLVSLFAINILSIMPVFAQECTAVRASHILVKTESDAKLMRSYVEKGLPFEDVAAGFSQCPSKHNGGDLGYFRRGKMVKEFENAAFSMEKGEISEPVKTQFGWHIIKVTDKLYRLDIFHLHQPLDNLSCHCL